MQWLLAGNVHLPHTSYLPNNCEVMPTVMPNVFVLLQLRDPWKVRILPRVAFATRLELPPAALPPPEGAATEAAAARASSPLLLAALPPGSRAAVVVHHWLGSWQHLVPGAGLLSWLLGPLWNMVARWVPGDSP